MKLLLLYCWIQVNLSSTTRLETMVQVDELAARLRAHGRGSFTTSTPSTTDATTTGATAAAAGATAAASDASTAAVSGSNNTEKAGAAAHDSDESAAAEGLASALQAAADPLYKVMMTHTAIKCCHQFAIAFAYARAQAVS
jgi:hypothetical protein